MLVANTRLSVNVTLPPLLVVPLKAMAPAATSDQSQEVPQELPLTPWVVLALPGVLPVLEAIKLM